MSVLASNPDMLHNILRSFLKYDKFLEKLVKTFIPFKEIIDWEMNFQNILHSGKALWADPPLAEQGTCFNRLVTSLPA